MGAFTNVQLSAAIASYVSCIFSPVAIFTTAVISRPSGTNRSLFPVDCQYAALIYIINNHDKKTHFSYKHYLLPL